MLLACCQGTLRCHQSTFSLCSVLFLPVNNRRLVLNCGWVTILVPISFHTHPVLGWLFFQPLPNGWIITDLSTLGICISSPCQHFPSPRPQPSFRPLVLQEPVQGRFWCQQPWSTIQWSPNHAGTSPFSGRNFSWLTAWETRSLDRISPRTKSTCCIDLFFGKSIC